MKSLIQSGLQPTRPAIDSIRPGFSTQSINLNNYKPNSFAVVAPFTFIFGIADVSQSFGSQFEPFSGHWIRGRLFHALVDLELEVEATVLFKGPKDSETLQFQSDPFQIQTH